MTSNKDLLGWPSCTVISFNIRFRYDGEPRGVISQLPPYFYFRSFNQLIQPSYRILLIHELSSCHYKYNHFIYVSVNKEYPISNNNITNKLILPTVSSNALPFIGINCI